MEAKPLRGANFYSAELYFLPRSLREWKEMDYPKFFIYNLLGHIMGFQRVLIREFSWRNSYGQHKFSFGNLSDGHCHLHVPPGIEWSESCLAGRSETGKTPTVGMALLRLEANEVPGRGGNTSVV